MNQQNAVQSFATDPIPKAVMKNALPAMAAMLMVLVYNLADIFFIGQTHNDYMVAAVSLCTPVFLIFTALGCLFGIGGTSMISRAMGQGRPEYAKKICSFCMWGCVISGALVSILLLCSMDPLVTLLGASPETASYAKTYLSIVAFCGLFSMLSGCFSNIIRAEGKSTVAMTGTVLGNLTNVILDPIMILTFNWGIAGAAIATVIGNVVGALYYLIYFWRGKSTLSISLRDFSAKDHILTGVLGIGIPASLGQILMSVSQMLVNGQMAAYGDMALAAYGVAAKVGMILATFAVGLGQGIQPLLGYCYGAKDQKRFMGCLHFSALFAFGLSLVIAALCFIFARPIVQAFLTDESALSMAERFARILASTGMLIGIWSVMLNAVQAMGAAIPSLLNSLCRQGFVFIPAVYILGSILGMEGLVWAQPVADVLSLILVALILLGQIRKWKVSD